ncbi:MAG: hypothetical protein V4671_04280, partial [Armatimonadota bacterium]
KAALVALWKGDDALSQLLINKETAAPGMIREGSRSQVASPVYPLITFRLPDHRPDPRFKPTAAEGHGPSPITGDVLEVECWSQQASSAQVEQIADRVQELMEAGPIPLSATSAIFQASCTMRAASLFDPGTKAWFTILRFKLRSHS